MMSSRSRIPQSLVEKYKNDICFMADTNFTYIEVVEPRIEFIDPLGYEISEVEIEGYVGRLLKCKVDTQYSRFGTFEENFSLAKATMEEK